MDKIELHLFAKRQCEILNDAHIAADFSYIEDSELTKKRLFRIIKNKVEQFVRQLPNIAMTLGCDCLNTIYDVKYRGTQFKYTYIKDLPVFKESDFDHFEHGNNSCFLIVLKNSDVYVVSTQFGELLYHKWEDCPNRHYPNKLLEHILYSIQPLLDYEFDEENREFATSLIKSCFPFNDHSLSHLILQDKEIRTMKYWEYRIKECPNLYLDRGTISEIKKYILRAFDDLEESPKWDKVIAKMKTDIAHV